MTQRVDPPVDTMQAAGVEPAVDGLVRDAESTELLAVDETVLLRGQCRKRRR